MGSFFEWSDQYDIGVPEMNDEHKELIRIMNKLHEQNESGADKNTLADTLTELANYVVKHFADEEAYMEKINFPTLSQHKRIHEDLVQKYTKHVEGFQAGDGKVSVEFFNFLRLWLAAHIKGIDMKYGQHANA